MSYSGVGLFQQLHKSNIITYDPTIMTGRKGYQMFNRVVRKIIKEDKLKAKPMDIDGKEVKIGDIVIATTYYKGYGVSKYKIVGETKTRWKVIDSDSKEDWRGDYIEKSNSVFICG